MSQMLQLIKNSAVPAAVMRSAAKGALSVPEAEMLEILVHLTHNAVFGQEAAMTLAKWNPESAAAVLSGEVPPDLLEYFLDPKNIRPALVPALIGNKQVAESRLAQLAAWASEEIAELMLASDRVKRAPDVLRALLENPRLNHAQAAQIREQLGLTASEPADPESVAAHEVWLQEHASDIAAEEGTAFELAAASEEEEVVAVSSLEDAGGASAKRTGELSSAARVSTLVKLSRMNVAQRVKQAFLGTKEERAILVRDPAKIVQNAVLASPKVGAPEVETFAAAKNVSENVLREIARNRRFIKIYAVVRNIVTNPRSPLDITLPLVKNLLVTDLKPLQTNKNVPDTLRKVAIKMFKEKTAPVGQKPEA